MKRTRIQLVKLTEIPPLPIASQRILATISQEYVTLTEVTEAVKPSPEITAQILRAANSAYFGFSGEVTSVDDAIKRVLGLDIVKSFVMVALLDKPFNSSQVPSFDARLYWRIAMITGLMAEKMLPGINADIETKDGEAFVAGLLINIGMFGLVHVFPEEMENTLKDPRSSDLASLQKLMQFQLKSDLFIAGGWLARQWQFPRLYQCIIENCNNSSYNGEYAPLVVLIGACYKIAFDLCGLQANLNESRLVFSSLGVSESMLEYVIDEVLKEMDGLSSALEMVA